MVFAPLLARSVPLSLRSIINQININPKIQNILHATTLSSSLHHNYFTSSASFTTLASALPLESLQSLRKSPKNTSPDKLNTSGSTSDSTTASTGGREYQRQLHSQLHSHLLATGSGLTRTAALRGMSMIKFRGARRGLTFRILKISFILSQRPPTSGRRSAIRHRTLG